MKLSIFLEEFGFDLEQKGLKIVMVRNFQGLPNLNKGTDLDLFISEFQISQFDDLIKKFCNQKKINLNFEYYNNRATYFLEGVEDKGNFCKLDVLNNLRWKGIPFYDINLLVKESKIFHKPIYIAKNKTIAAYIIFCQSFLFGGFINNKYINLFRQVILENKTEFFLLLILVFSKKESEYLIRKIKEHHPFVPRLVANYMRIKVILRYYLGKLLVSNT